MFKIGDNAIHEDGMSVRIIDVKGQQIYVEWGDESRGWWDDWKFELVKRDNVLHPEVERLKTKPRKPE